MPPSFLERKQKLDGSISEYRCDLLHYDPSLVIVRFIHDRPYEGPVTIPSGAGSLGFFWPERNYNVYRITSPAGHLLAHRFDALRDVTITPAAVHYYDLVLDWWLLPNRALLEEDRDEFDGAVASGLLSHRHAALAEATGTLLRAQAPATADECGTLAQRFVAR